MRDFENYLCERNDLIDNAVYDVIRAMTASDINYDERTDPAIPDWNMSAIGEIGDIAEAIILEKVGHTCHPYYTEDEVPCYLDEDCKNKYCVFRQEGMGTPPG